MSETHHFKTSPVFSMTYIKVKKGRESEKKKKIMPQLHWKLMTA
jgi:hypothetical protein